MSFTLDTPLSAVAAVLAGKDSHAAQVIFENFDRPARPRLALPQQ